MRVVRVVQQRKTQEKIHLSFLSSHIMQTWTAYNILFLTFSFALPFARLPLGWQHCLPGLEGWQYCPAGKETGGLAGHSELGLWLLQTSSGQLCWKQCIGCVRLPPSLLMSSKKRHPTLRRLEGSVLRARLLSITLVTVPIPVLFSRRTQLQRILLWKCLGSQGRERIGETSYVPSLPPSVPKRSLFHPEGPP